AAFGDDIVQADGTLNRSLLRQIVFADANKRKRLEAILHPRVRKTMRAEMADLNVPYCILVIPLLIESRQHDMVDRILVVDAPDPRRIAWIKQRSGLNENQIQEIFRAQASREKRLEAADDLLVNDRDVAHLLHQVDEMHRKYCRLAGAGK
ncbi:MAG: dephospho-CoA kinase, partial [Gammaproteobacteria bacterium]|nr:dephospho-CoA kinase [Gammaproteobacteria bacterium]